MNTLSSARPRPSLLIATLKAGLILLYFVRVRYSRALISAVAGAGFFWLAILFGLTFGDYLPRAMGNEVVAAPQPGR